MSEMKTGIEKLDKAVGRAGDSILPFLLEHAKKRAVSFHMPGHKGSKIFERFGYGDFFRRIADCDITEIRGADNLFRAESIIDATMERYRKLYGSRRSYLLVNGSSCGLIAAILTLTRRGDKIIMARNSHKSVFSGVETAEAIPVYAYPEMLGSYGITGKISAEEIERLLVENPEAKCVVLPSPNYYGICSEIEAIAKVCHGHGAKLIVDQAHGAHLIFMERNLSAELSGADIVIGSIHKTLCSFTQSAIVNVMSDDIDIDVLEENLQKMESTSPSYLLMGSLDINADIIEKHGEDLFAEWGENLDHFYGESKKIKGLKIIDDEFLDRTKINIDMSALGYSGYDLENIMIASGLYPELVTADILMCMTGIGNRREDYDKLLDVLRELPPRIGAGRWACSGNADIGMNKRSIMQTNEIARDSFSEGKNKEIVCDSISEDKDSEIARDSISEDKDSEIVYTPIPGEKRRIPLCEAEGEICAQALVPYPPGIPEICPGEKFTKELVDGLLSMRQNGVNIIGISGAGTVSVKK
ncbi:hypothetical protein AXF21_06515 [Eubacterium minutum ATCC 700079]|nr:hypothetical protein AXF21_06515 [Eubacterium minutum ATCC 700079]